MRDKAVYVRLLELRVDEGAALRIAETRDAAWVEGWKAEYEQPKAGFKGSLAAVLVGMHDRNKNPPAPPPKPAPPISLAERRRREKEAEEARLAALPPEERERMRREADELLQRCLAQRIQEGPPIRGRPALPEEGPEALLLAEGIRSDVALRLARKRPRDWIEAQLAELRAQGFSGRDLGRALAARDEAEEDTP